MKCPECDRATRGAVWSRHLATHDVKAEHPSRFMKRVRDMANDPTVTDEQLLAVIQEGPRLERLRAKEEGDG